MANYFPLLNTEERAIRALLDNALRTKMIYQLDDDLKQPLRVFLCTNLDMMETTIKEAVQTVAMDNGIHAANWGSRALELVNQKMALAQEEESRLKINMIHNHINRVRASLASLPHPMDDQRERYESIGPAPAPAPPSAPPPALPTATAVSHQQGVEAIKDILASQLLPLPYVRPVLTMPLTGQIDTCQAPSGPTRTATTTSTAAPTTAGPPSIPAAARSRSKTPWKPRKRRGPTNREVACALNKEAAIKAKNERSRSPLATTKGQEVATAIPDFPERYEVAETLDEAGRFDYSSDSPGSKEC